MKHLIAVLFLTIILNSVNSQTISPAQTGEFCPNTEYTFTAIITKPYSNLIGINGFVITQGPQAPFGTTFTFKGKFADANQKQTIQVTHPDNTVTLFEFKKIKSLYYSTPSTANQPCNVIKPNQTQPVVFPRCQLATSTISFPNIQWFTNFESPELCFGAVTDYEYLLPAGWQLGSTISNGSTWISGGNSVTVTSDLWSGDGMDIRIRGSNNTCASGLAANGPVSTVRISRPAPTLSITSAQYYICSGCQTFTVNGIPAGATVQWNLSNTTDAYINGCSTCSMVSVCRNTTANTIITLNATVSDCTGSYPVVTHDISLGITAPTSVDFQLIDPTFGKIRAITPLVTGATSYNWYINGSLNSLYHSNGATFAISSDCDIQYDISVEAVNSCGTSLQTHANAYVPCGSSFMVSPNPASSNVTISADQTKSANGSNTTFDEVRLYDMEGNLKKYLKVNKAKTAKINIAGITNGTYFLEIINGFYKERKQLLILK